LKGEEEESFYEAQPVTVLANAYPCTTNYFFTGTDGFAFPYQVKTKSFCKILSGLTTLDPLERYSPKGVSFIQSNSPTSCVGGWGASINFTPLGGSFDRILEIPLTE